MIDRSLPIRGWVFLLAAAAGTVCGCRNPLVTYDDEYGWVADSETLHSAKVLPLGDKVVAEPQDTAPPPGEPRTNTFPGGERLEVSIEECRAWTLENNLDLQVSLMEPGIAQTAISEEEAQFEAVFVTRARVSDADPGQAEVFRDQFVRPWDVDPTVLIPLRTGGTATVGLSLSERETFPAFEDFALYATDIDFSISQPLLRNAGRRANTHFIRIAALDSQIAEARTKLQVIRQIAAADRAYWLLYEATKLLVVRQEQYEHAVEQLEEAGARFRGGVGPEIEVVRARAGLSRRLESIIIAELRLKDAQRVLKRIMNLEGVDVESPVMLVLTSEPDPVRYELDSDDLLAVSLEERVELLELEIRLAQDLSTIDFERNRKLPLFTLDYTYRIHGSGSTFGDSVESAANWEGWGWKLGANLEVPIGNEAAEARLERVILTRLQRLATRSAREQTVKREVLDAIDNLEATWQRIQAALQSVFFEGLNYRAERGQYRLGLRNSTEVLDAEDRLADAKAAEISSVVDYQIAQVDLAFATGMLLGAARVAW